MFVVVYEGAPFSSSKLRLIQSYAAFSFSVVSFCVTEQGSPMYSFLRFASDGCSCLNALCRTKRNAKVALLSFYLYNGAFMLEAFCEGSFKASRLVVQTGFARDDVVP